MLRLAIFYLWGLCVVGFFLFPESSLADTKKTLKSVRYKSFYVSLDSNHFTYESKFFRRKIKINSCNRDLAKIFLKGLMPKKEKLP